MKLLTSSAKTVKGEELGYFTMVQYLMAGKKSGYNMCPMASDACLDLCLGHNQRNAESGMYHYHSMSPCVMDPDFLTGKSMTDCASNAECNADKVKQFK